MPQSFSVKAILEAVDTTFSSTIEKADKAVQGFSSNTNNRLSGVGKAMMVAGAATTAMGVAGLKSFGKFQQSLNTAAVVAGGTSKDISGLAEQTEEQAATIRQQDKTLHTAYYVFGTMNELKEQKILSSGFLRSISLRDASSAFFVI